MFSTFGDMITNNIKFTASDVASGPTPGHNKIGKGEKLEGKKGRGREK